MTQFKPAFNLWAEPWITLERADGALEQAGIGETLLQASEIRAIYDPSPLVIVGVHRLLTAILQDTFDPRRPPDLRRLWLQQELDEQVRPGRRRVVYRRPGDV